MGDGGYTRDATGTADGPHRIGVVGAGHWAEKFDDVAGDTVMYSAAADVEPYSAKADILDALGVPEERYHNIADETDGVTLPETFFDAVDAVQIASPIQFHRDQTMQALEQVDTVVAEKAYGPVKADFDAVMAYADETGGLTYPHLHYLRKQPTMALDAMIDDYVAEYGAITDVDAAFIESYDPEDERRSWIYRPENGGIVMDWIHPVEVLAAACDATFTGVEEATPYLTAPAYTTDHPTATRTTYTVDGDLFTDDATATVRIGKGFPDGATRKVLSLELADAALDVVYADSSQEQTSDYRGQLRCRPDADRLEPVDITVPTGDTPYRLMATDMITAIEDQEPPVSRDALATMYTAVDVTNAVLAGQDPVTDEAAIQALLDESWQRTTV